MLVQDGPVVAACCRANRKQNKKQASSQTIHNYWASQIALTSLEKGFVCCSRTPKASLASTIHCALFLVSQTFIVKFWLRVCRTYLTSAALNFQDCCRPP